MNLSEFSSLIRAGFREPPYSADYPATREDILLLAEAIKGSLLEVVKMLPKEQHGHNFKE